MMRFDWLVNRIMLPKTFHSAVSSASALLTYPMDVMFEIDRTNLGGPFILRLAESRQQCVDADRNVMDGKSAQPTSVSWLQLQVPGQRIGRLLSTPPCLTCCCRCNQRGDDKIRLSEKL